MAIDLLGYFLANYSTRIPRQSLEEAMAWQEEHYDLSWYPHVEKKEYLVAAEDGYILHAMLLRNPDPSITRYVLISHGYTDNRFGSLKYAKVYFDLGFHVIVYDLRGHGANEASRCTYSVQERRDLLMMIYDSRERYPDATVLGIHGESLGAATSAAVLEFAPPIDFVVADCGFSEITTVMKRGLRGMHLPGFLVYLASQFAKPLCGYHYRDMRPVDSLKGNTVPVLFIHGEEDDFIVPEHSAAFHEANQGYSERKLVPGAGHAASVLTDPELYRNYVEDFLRTIGVLPQR
ncbi:MAG: alpha/beta fold hydrolase [Mogibacterium sp.]|nr:alpha/beta fold hydrolase [Mogibacterium sp.]